MITPGDITGSVGNFGTVLPLLVAVALTSGMSLSLIILLCGCWYILSGIIYKCPVSVEPLKAVAAISITLHLSPGVIAASGIVIGIIFIILGCMNGMEWMQNHIPPSVVRGVQLGLGFILLKSSILDFGVMDIFPFFFGIACILLLYVFITIRRVPDFSALFLLTIGIGSIVYQNGIPPLNLPDLPVLVLPAPEEYYDAGLNLVIPQIPVSIGNAILATSLLLSDLYHYKIPVNKLSITMGLMSVSTSILGGFPLCHGSGGIAAHHRFGGKSGYTMVIGGIILIVLASLFTNQDLIHSFPQGLFGALLAVVAIELITLGARTDTPVVTGIMGIIAVFGGMTFSLLGGILFAAAYPYISSLFTHERDDT